MFTAHVFAFANQDGIIEEVGVFGSEMPSIPTGIFFQLSFSIQIPSQSGNSYEEAKSRTLEICKRYQTPGSLGDAIRSLGKTGNRTKVIRQVKYNYVPSGFTQAVNNEGAIIGSQVFVSGTVNLPGPKIGK